MSTVPEQQANAATQAAGRHGKAERIEHFLKTCRLLSLEVPPLRHDDIKVDETPGAAGGSPQGTRPHAFAKVLLASTLVTLLLVVLAVAAVIRPVLRSVPDYRWGTDYRARPATDAVHDPDANEVHLSTQGAGVHAVGCRTGYFRQFTQRSTGGGLLTDDVMQLQRDDEGRMYFLCQEGRSRGLCRRDPATGHWRTLMGIQHFDALTATPAPRLTSVLATGDQLWLGTDGAGVGVYSPATHGWEAVHQAAGGNLLDDHVRDLLADPEGRIWIATAAGLNRVAGGVWESFTVPDPLVGQPVQQLGWGRDRLWYVTQDGGLGAFDGEEWETIASESRWGSMGDSDVVLVADDPRHQRLWCVASNHTVGLYDRATRTWQSFAAPGDDVAIHGIAPGADTEAPALWAATSQGMFRLDGDAPKWSAAGLPKTPLAAIDAGRAAVVAMTRPPSGQAKTAGQQPESSSEQPAAVFAQAAPDWVTWVGAGRGPAKTIVSAAAVGADRLVVGHKKGISCYDLNTHEWSAGPPLLLGADGSGTEVLDLQADGSRALALTGSRSVVAWDPASGQQTLLAGGDRFTEVELSKLTAVTRAATGGLLWLATERALYTYDPVRRKWSQVANAPGSIRQLVAGSDGVWALADGVAYACWVQPPQRVPGVEHLKRLFAWPEAPEVLALDNQERVFRLRHDQPPQIVVGDSAPRLDLTAVRQVAAADNLLVLGGPQPYLYDAKRRHWSQLRTGATEQVLAAVNRLWLRTSQRQVYSLTPPADQPAKENVGGRVEQLAGDGQRLVALLEDQSIRWRDATGPWTTAKTAAAAAPAAALLSDPGLVALAAGEALALAGGPSKSLWVFDWPKQAWQAAADERGQPLSGVTRLAASSTELWAVAGGQLFSARDGQARWQRGKLTGVQEVQAVGNTVAAVQATGEVVLNDNGNWQPLSFAAGSSRAGARLEVRDAIDTPTGLLVAGGDGSAILARTLASWTSVSGGTDITRLYAFPGDQSVWGTSSRGTLYRLADDAWAKPDLGGQEVASLTVGCGAQRNRHWASLRSGGLAQVAADAVHLWHQPAAAAGGPADVVGIAPASPPSDGYLVAFRNGGLSRCKPGVWAFSDVKGPEVKGGISRFTFLGPSDAPKAYWLLAADGQLHFQPAGGNWKPIAKDVSAISVAEEGVLAVTAKGRGLTVFDAAGQSVPWLDAVPLPPLKSVVAAAGELFVADQSSWLVLSDGQSTAAYDPQTRCWTSLANGYVEFSPSRDSLLARTAAGDTARLIRNGGALQSQPLQLDAQVKVRRLWGTPESTAVLGWLQDGRLVLVDGASDVRDLIGAQLSVAEVQAVAACGDKFYVASADGIYRYDRKSRSWEKVWPLPVGMTAPVRLLAEERALWVEAAFKGQGLLFRLDQRPAGGWTPTRIADNPSGWERAAGGVLVLASANGKSEAQYYTSAEAKPLTLNPLSPPGPPDNEVVAVSSSGGRLWLRTSKQELWSYHRGTRGWMKSQLPEKTEVSAAVLEAEIPAVVTAQKKLLLGSCDMPTGSWAFADVAPIASFLHVDGDRELLAYAAADRVVLHRASAAVGGQTVVWQFNSAWTGDRKVAALASAGNLLYAASDGGDVSVYDLEKRSWRNLPQAPWAVRELFVLDDRLHALGANGKCGWLNGQGDGWDMAATAAQPKWQHGGQTWQVDKAGFVQAGDSAPTAPAASPPSPAAAPRRVHVDGQRVWLEFADGSLWSYDESSRYVRCAVAAEGPAAARREGLVTVGTDAYFVDAAAGRVWWLPPRPAEPVEVKKIPDGAKAATISLTPASVLLSAGDLTVVVTRDQVREVTADAAKNLRDQAQPLPAQRQLKSGTWRVVTNADGTPARLMRQVAGTDQEAVFDSATQRFAWDVATAGMAWGGQHLVATRGGLAVHDADPRSAPTAFLPVSVKAPDPLQLQVWGLADDRALIAAADGRRWILQRGAGRTPGPLVLTAESESVWKVSRGEGAWSVSLAQPDRPAAVISISPRGRLGIDNVTSVAFFGDALFLGTDDAVLEYQRDLSALRGIARAGHKLRVLADGANGRLLAWDDSVQAYDGKAWTPSTSEALKAAAAHRLLRAAAGGAAPLQLELPRGDGKSTVPVEYRGGRLLSDAPHSADGQPTQTVTTDGTHWYLATPVGLTVLDRQGGLVAVQPLPGGALALAWRGSAEAPVLHARAGDKSVWRLDGTAMQKVDVVWDRLPHEVHYAGHQRFVEPVGRRFRLTSATDKTAPEQWLDPAFGGFAQDVVQDALLTKGAVWKLAGGTLERLTLAGAIDGAWPLTTGPQEKIRLRALPGGAYAVAGSRILQLPEAGGPQPVTLDADGREALSALCAGRRWTCQPTGGQLSVVYRSHRGPLQLPFDPAEGFACDRLWQAMKVPAGLVLDTAGGSFLSPLGRSVALDDLRPLAFDPPARGRVEELWAAPDGTAFCRLAGSADAWYQLDAQKPTWKLAGRLPGENQTAHDDLLHCGTVTWRRRGADLEVVETTPAGECPTPLDSTSRRFSCDRVLAAVEEPEGTLWLLTPAGLRQVDAGTGRLLAVDAAPAFCQGTGGSFLHAAGRWLLRLERDSSVTYYELVQGKWRAVPDDPLLTPQTVAEWPLFHASREKGQLLFKLRLQSQTDRWLPVQFVPDKRRFDFQMADAAVASAECLHTLSPCGVVTWKRMPKGVEYVGLRPDLQALDVAPDRSCAVAGKQQGAMKEEYRDGSDHWTPVPAGADPQVRGESSRWQVRRAERGGVSLGVQLAKGRWQDLPLHDAGDFAFRRPQQVAVDQAGTGWTISSGMLTGYQAAAQGCWVPQEFQTAGSLSGGKSGTLDEVFLWKDSLYLRGGEAVYTRTADGVWQAADRQVLTERGQLLWSGQGWTWRRSEKGLPEITHQLSSEVTLPLTWDATADRFDRDVVTDVAVAQGHLWLAHRDGLTQLEPVDCQTRSFLKASQSASRRFGLLRFPNLQLLAAEDVSGAAAVTVEIADNAARWGTKATAEQAAAVYQVAYADAEWEFKGDPGQPLSSLKWRGVPSDLKGGFFAQDFLDSLVLDGSDLWTSSRAGIIRQVLDPQQLMIAEVLPLPDPEDRRLEVVQASRDAVRVVSQEGKVFQWQRERGAWSQQPAAAPPARVLVDTAWWTWSREGIGQARSLAVRVKLADDPALTGPLVDGRFPFDDVAACLVDGDQLWLAGNHGIVRRDATTGALQRWFRTGVSRPLRGLVALRRFRATGEPLASAAADEDRRDAKLYALDAEGQAWAYDDGDPGVWTAVANPWQTAQGRVVLRTDALEAVQNDAGRLALRYRQAAALDPAPANAAASPVLAGGRFAADVVRSVAWWQDRCFWSTAAGLLEVDEHSRHVRLWAAPAWDRVVVKSDNQRLYATGSGEHVLEFDPAARAWHPVAADAEFRAALDIRHRDEFWSWSRWQDQLQVRLLKADSQGSEWPLFEDGRFSFDVLRNFRLSGLQLWATTPGGIVQFRREDMQIQAIHRVARDRDTGQPVLLRDAEQFVATAQLACSGETYRYEYRDDEWLRSVRTAGGPEAAAGSYEDQTWRWTVTPGAGAGDSATSVAGGLLIQCFRRSGTIRDQNVLLPQVPSARFRRVVAADGRLWICLDYGLYVYTPR